MFTHVYLWLNRFMDILYTDEHILIVNKPAGLPVLPDGWEKGAPYLVKLLEEEYGKIWIVHRLDKVTSGIIVFARTAAAHRHLNMQLEKHEVQKIYHAIVNGVPTWEEKTAKHPLRANVGHRHRTIVDTKTGKPSETRFKVIKRYQSQALVEASPVTGRTHQVRVHAMALGYSLVGDHLYGASETDLIARPALHAYSLSFTHPESKELIKFTASYPSDFRATLDRLNG